jgi:hypothetical protein
MPDVTTDGPLDTGPVASDDIATETFTVSVTGNGVELTRKVDQATALGVIATVLSGGTAPLAVPSAPGVPMTPSGTANPRRSVRDATEHGGDVEARMSVGEYLDQCEARQNPAKITAIGHYLEAKLGQGSFTRDEVKSQFRPAGEKVPGNYSRDFADAIAQRWIAEDPDAKGRYYVTNPGKTAIAEKFGKPIRRAPTRRKTGNGEV